MGYHGKRVVIKLGVAVVVFTLVSITVVLGFFKPLDEGVYQHLSWRNMLVEAFSATADIVFLVAVWLVLVAADIARFKRVSLHSLELGLLLFITVLLDASLKLLFRIPRPGLASIPSGNVLLSIDYYGYPSGHATRAFAIAVLEGKRRGIASALFYAWALGICFTRLLLGVHWFSDVLGGVVAGFIAYYTAEILLGPVLALAGLVGLGGLVRKQ
ncbi:phosphatase PAP2 family protein [Thermogladius sp. 4427co]|uniref:phosphatase PAP2 family protein n=1 Tax=Thermogladius sp. 4427co TaxID=3450718 RepID=UPI003F7B328E